VTEGERDKSLRLFSRRPAEQGEATRWLQPWRRDTKRKPPEIEDLPVYGEVFQTLVEATPIEQRLAGFAPEQRLAGRAPAPWILALPLKVLRVLPEEYRCSLPAEVQEQVRKRPQGAATEGGVTSPRGLTPGIVEYRRGLTPGVVEHGPRRHRIAMLGGNRFCGVAIMHRTLA
jgi:hypothetical protein